MIAHLKGMAVVAVMLLTLLSCGGGKKKYVIGVSQCSTDIWREKLNDEMRSSAYLHDNVTLKVLSAKDDSRLQMKQINAFVDEGVDLLVVAPNQSNSVTPAVERAYDKGIPVILFDRKTNSEKYTALIGADNVRIGHIMGEFIAKESGGRGTVVEITGLKGSSPAAERHRGFVSALRSYPGIKLLASGSGTWLESSGEEVMDSLIRSGIRQIDYVFAHNDRMALGARTAARTHGLGDIKYVGIDGLPSKRGGMRMVRDSVLEASLVYPTEGDKVLELAMNILEKRPFRRINHNTPKMITRFNADIAIAQAEDMARVSGRLEKMRGKTDLYLTQYNHQKVYLALSGVILVLMFVLFMAVYRVILIKRRMAEDTAEAKLAFFTGVSHDFRTPLTLIADPVARLMKDGGLKAPQLRLLEIIKKNSDIMQRLVGEILDFRKVQNGSMKLDIGRFDLARSVTLWTDSFRPQAEAKEITVSCEASGSLEIEADELKTERIVYNLLSNAIKYNRSGGSVKVSVRRSEATAVITVADTGIGVSRDMARHVFDRFFMVNASAEGGTGIGLALVKAFAELHGGSVALSSREGSGSVFTVTLPVKSKHGAAAETGAKAKEIGSGVEMITSVEGDGGRFTVLVVDDNKDMRDYVAELLAAKYDVKCAADGREGLDVCMKTVPDVVVSDVMMPVMDGLEMCRRIKGETATSHIPVIMLTAKSMEEQRAEGYDCGADAYITKPFSSSVLLARIRNLIDGRRRMREIWAGKDTGGNRPSDPDMRFMHDFREVVSRHLADSGLSVETVAAGVGLSRVQLYRKVKHITGASPVEVIRITRLKQADSMLKTTSKTVSEISYEVGFSSPSYFSKCFKDYYGIMPQEARKV